MISLHSRHLTRTLVISVYISGRPFVLRDASEPRKTLHLSDRAENLEGIEIRLKNDILAEATKYTPLCSTLRIGSSYIQIRRPLAHSQ